MDVSTELENHPAVQAINAVKNGNDDSEIVGDAAND